MSGSPVRRQVLAAVGTLALTAAAVVALASPAAAATDHPVRLPVRHRHGLLQRPAVLADGRAGRGAVAERRDVRRHRRCSWPTVSYRLSAPLRLTADDSGSNGYTVVWQAAPSARPVISGARAVTGWSVGRRGPQHLAGQRRRRDRLPAALRQRRHRHPGPHAGEPGRLHRLEHRHAVLQRRPELPEQPGQPEPGRDGERQLVHRPVRAGAEHQREPHHDAAAGVEQQQLRLRHLHQPAPGRPALPDQRVRVPRLARRVVPRPRRPGCCPTSRSPGRT